LTRTGTEG